MGWASLGNIKVGDRLGRREAYGRGIVAIETIVRVTATQAVMGSGVRINRKWGEIVGSTKSYGGASYELMSDAEIEAWKYEQNRLAQAKRLQAMDWHKFTLTQLIAVMDLLNSWSDVTL